jgi:hypothetical protein
MSAGPYPQCRDAVALHVGVGLVAIGMAVWAGAFHPLSPFGWAVAATAGAVGVLLPLASSPRVQRFLTSKVGAEGIAFVVIVIEITRDDLRLPPDVTPPLFAFLSGVLFACAFLVSRVLRTRYSAHRNTLAEAGAFGDPLVREQIEGYFSAISVLLEQRIAVEKELQRTFKMCSRRPDHSWDTAALAIREYVDGLDRYLDGSRAISIPECLRPVRAAQSRIVEDMQAEWLRAAEDLEQRRPVDFKKRFKKINRRGIEQDREWYYAIGMLAKHHRVTLPPWFVKNRKRMAQAF